MVSVLGISGVMMLGRGTSGCSMYGGMPKVFGGNMDVYVGPVRRGS